MAQVITVAQQKGGAGKTTLASNLAAGFAADGRRVAVLDCDPQGSLGRWFLERMQGDAPEMELSTASAWGAGWEVKKLARTHDLIVIDTPPKLDGDLRPAIKVADVVVVPVGGVAGGRLGGRGRARFVQAGEALGARGDRAGDGGDPRAGAGARGPGGARREGRGDGAGAPGGLCRGAGIGRRGGGPEGPRGGRDGGAPGGKSRDGSGAAEGACAGDARGDAQGHAQPMRMGRAVRWGPAQRGVRRGWEILGSSPRMTAWRGGASEPGNVRAGGPCVSSPAAVPSYPQVARTRRAPSSIGPRATVAGSRPRRAQMGATRSSRTSALV